MPSLSQFTASRTANWRRLESLLARSNGNSLRHLKPDELDALARCYRQAASDLAIARRDFPEDQITLSLNALASRAHLRVYQAPASSLRQVGSLFSLGFARRFRAARGYLALSAALFFLPAAWAYLAALLDPQLREALVPAQLRALMERGQTWTQIDAASRPVASAVIFTHNIQVSFLAFGGGVLLGLGTAYVLLSNGLMLGGVLGAAQSYGVLPVLGSFVSPHGYLELTAVVIAGAAGLMLGHGLLRPGLLRRRDATIRAARSAVQLVAGVLPIFVVAGLIEGLISPSELPPGVKLAIGPLTAVALFSLLLTLGRERAPRRR